MNNATGCEDRVAGSLPDELVTGRSLSSEIAKKAAHEKNVTFTPHTIPDNHGRQEFTADWIGEQGRKRGQVFRTVLEVIAGRYQDNGYQVHVSQVTPK